MPDTGIIYKTVIAKSTAYGIWSDSIPWHPNEFACDAGTASLTPDSRLCIPLSGVVNLKSQNEQHGNSIELYHFSEAQ